MAGRESRGRHRPSPCSSVPSSLFPKAGESAEPVAPASLSQESRTDALLLMAQHGHRAWPEFVLEAQMAAIDVVEGEREAWLRWVMKLHREGAS